MVKISKHTVKKAKQLAQLGLFERVILAKIAFLDFLAPLGFLLMRVWVAKIFFTAGINKLSDWDSTLFLFAEEYKTHEKLTLFGNKIFTPNITATLGTSFEIIMPLLLIAGVASRFSAFVLFFMTLVIEYTYISSPEHEVWALMLFIIMVNGAGRFSWDYFIKGRYFGLPEKDDNKDKSIALLATIAITIYTGWLAIENIRISL